MFKWSFIYCVFSKSKLNLRGKHSIAFVHRKNDIICNVELYKKIYFFKQIFSHFHKISLNSLQTISFQQIIYRLKGLGRFSWLQMNAFKLLALEQMHKKQWVSSERRRRKWIQIQSERRIYVHSDLENTTKNERPLRSDWLEYTIIRGIEFVCKCIALLDYVCVCVMFVLCSKWLNYI